MKESNYKSYDELPLFLNAVASPTIPRLARCLALGQAVGRFLAHEPRRTLLIGSGGLSHEPPVPTLAHPDPAVRERITVPTVPTAAERDAKTRRVMAAGVLLNRFLSAFEHDNWPGRDHLETLLETPEEKALVASLLFDTPNFDDPLKVANEGLRILRARALEPRLRQIELRS